MKLFCKLDFLKYSENSKENRCHWQLTFCLATLLKKELLNIRFPLIFVKFFKKNIFIWVRHLWTTASAEKHLTYYRQILQLCRNQSIDFQSKSIDWFLYEGNSNFWWANVFHFLRRVLLQCSAHNLFSLKRELGTTHIWHPWKRSSFQDPHTPCPATSKNFP